MPPSEIREYIRNVVDIVIQLKRGSGGKRYVSEVYFDDRADLSESVGG
jgi:type IV secretion system protein VirB11